MSKRTTPARRATAARKKPPAQRPPAFAPASTRARHDGWTPERQIAFIDALAESGCVTEACAAIGITARSAYRLRARIDAQGFRLAWDAALDYAIRRLTDVCLSRALHGEAIPHFFRGEQVGEHRRYDNRLAMFLLRYHAPLRYAATLDHMVYDGHVESAAIRFARARDRAEGEAHGIAATEYEADAAPFTATPIAQEMARRAQAANAPRPCGPASEADQRALMQEAIAKFSEKGTPAERGTPGG